jgi:hypothetical protein
MLRLLRTEKLQRRFPFSDMKLVMAGERTEAVIRSASKELSAAIVAIPNHIRRHVFSFRVVHNKSKTKCPPLIYGDSFLGIQARLKEARHQSSSETPSLPSTLAGKSRSQ